MSWLYFSHLPGDTRASSLLPTALLSSTDYAALQINLFTLGHIMSPLHPPYPPHNTGNISFLSSAHNSISHLILLHWLMACSIHHVKIVPSILGGQAVPHRSSFCLGHPPHPSLCAPLPTNSPLSIFFSKESLGMHADRWPVRR